jgi:uncharacterized protein involved in exopolysaccharide biosynthesis
VLAVSLALAAVWVLSTTRLYESEAIVVYDKGAQPASVGANADSDSPRQVASRLNDMLMSRQRLEVLIKEFNLYPSVVDGRGMQEAVEQMRKRLHSSAREGYAFRVAFAYESRVLAQRVLQKLLSGIIDEDARHRLREAEQTKTFLDTERKHADEDLRTKEAAMSAFIAEHPQFSSEAGGAAAVGVLSRAAERERAPGGSGAEIAQLQLQAANYKEQLAAASRPGSIAEAVADPTAVGALTRAQVELQAAQHELADKQARYTNEHPDVRAALRRVTDAEAAVKRAERAVQTSRSTPVIVGGERIDDGGGRVAALREALAAVNAQIAAARSRASQAHADVPRTTPSVVAIDTEWTRLSRDVSEARSRQSALEGKQSQAQILLTLVTGGLGGRLVIADPPFRPMRPIAGGRAKIAVVAGLASVMLALLAVAILAFLDDRLYGERDVERVMGEGIVVVIPKSVEKGG